MRSGERVACNGNGPLLRERLPVESNAFDLVQRHGREVALAAMRAAHDRKILYHEQVLPLAIASRNMSYAGSRFATDVADHVHISDQSRYTVTITSLPVGLSLATTVTGAPPIAGPWMTYFHSPVL